MFTKARNTLSQGVPAFVLVVILLVTIFAPGKFTTPVGSIALVEAQVRSCATVFDEFCGGIVAAHSISGTVTPTCTCSCRVPRFVGTFCEKCGRGYGGFLCDECLHGWTGYPTCVDQCLNATSSCAGHATGFGGPPGACTCVCAEGYQAPYCDSCSVGYTGYPNCYEACTSSSVSCSGHADYVYGSPPVCLCRCSIGYGGMHCDRCAIGFSGTYPACVDDCVEADSSCSGHASRVTGPSPNCVCSCIRGYDGSRCERCAVGFTGYPNCYDNCTDPAVSCNQRGSSVVGTAFPLCRCTCTAMFEGNMCERCIKRRTGWPLCSTCADGYSPFPTCDDACTNVNVSCGGFAFNVTRGPYGCLCSCFPQFTGATCASCAEGYSGPRCLDQCRFTRVSCSDRASTVALDPLLGRCKCECLKGYAGDKCERCAPGYAGFPNCFDNCTLPAVSCESRAFAVTGTPPSCQCQCFKQYRGSLCQQCADGFAGTVWPSCADQCRSTALSCNNNAYFVQSRGVGLGCLCNCTHGFAGETCERCEVGFEGAACERCVPGFRDYPYCIDDCTNATSSCNGKAIAVGGLSPKCVCYCLPGWDGPRCTFCARGYLGNNCDQCAPGFHRNGQYCIETCTDLTVSCNRRAVAIGGSNGNCTCDCTFQYGGARCERCATGYTGQFCDRCGPSGYSGYPNCKDDCSNINVSCGVYGKSVLRLNGLCVCTCKPQYAGPKCTECAAGYSDFPQCTDACTLPAISCHNNATGVFGVPPQGCVCECVLPFAGRLCNECRFGLTGAKCDQCLPGFYGPDCLDNCTDVTVSCYSLARSVRGSNGNCTCDCLAGISGDRCDRCIDHFGGYPACKPACVPSRCNDRVVAVDGVYPDCICRCLRQFAGDTCERCAPNFMGATCNMCAPGYVSAPNCVDGCSNVTVSCNGNAESVMGSYPACVCKCKRGFTGANCGSCSQGFEFYPFCSDACTHVGVSCNASRAISVSGTGPDCVCECMPTFGGPRCASCQYGFSGENCDRCSPGFNEYGLVYPTCTDNCTSTAVSCNGRANGVTGSHGVCTCACISRFTGRRCTECARGFGTAVDGPLCGECAPGFIEYPLCYETCSHPAVSCNGNAVAVTGSFPDCFCRCKTGFRGVRCDSCAIGYTGPRCGTCITGFGGYPFCREDCSSVLASCSNRAFSVQRNMQNMTQCICDCHPQWALPDCATCFKSFDGPLCDRCAAGFGPYPDCPDACTNATVSCNGIGITVNGTAGACRCTCPFGFSGNRCERCAPGFGGYPQCSEDCTSTAVSCLGRATGVSGMAPNCLCQCTERFTGARCLQCAPAYNGSLCDRCASGFSGYPGPCVDDCTNVTMSCRGHGIRVRGSNDNCECVCHTNYTGMRCEACADGFSGYPTCRDSCTNATVSCNGVGLNVSGAQHDACTCVCPPTRDGDRCERCKAGRTGWPLCEDGCSLISVSCNNNAESVTPASVPTSEFPCQCRCKRGFGGPKCGVCASGFVDYPSCFDACTLPLASCNGFAKSVVPSAGGCRCDCFANFSGTMCGACAEGFASYPQCFDNCTNVTVSCGINGSSVVSIPAVTTMEPPSPPTCVCSCLYGFAGRKCERCALGFAGRNCDQCLPGYTTTTLLCDSCAPGYTGYPLCAESCTVVLASCNGYASGVVPVLPVVNSPPPHGPFPNSRLCNCSCLPGYAGPRCGWCAEGFAGYPLCVDTCRNVNVSCNGKATAVSNITAPDCNCTCLANFTGSRCERCKSGFGPYPDCLDSCSDANVSCSGPGRAPSVSVGSPASQWRECRCACRPQFVGLRCQSCASGYSGPQCLDDCTSTLVSCNNRATSVSGSNGNCACACFPEYAQPACGACAVGFTGFPNCYDNCSHINVSCSGNAAAVVPAVSGRSCRCTCLRGFEGARCERCVLGFGMLPQLGQTYPRCFDSCVLTSVSCNSRASAVAQSNATPAQMPAWNVSCACSCIRGYDGATCERCGDGFAGWPTCVESCSSVRISCNDHASNVSGTFPSCVCTCLRGFTGRSCDRCDRGFGAGGYPNCEDDCTDVSVTCGVGGAAVSSNANPPTGCVCECLRGFSGPRCEECAPGFSPFPRCEDDCTNVNVSCNGKAFSVRRADYVAPSSSPQTRVPSSPPLPPSSSTAQSMCLCECFPTYSGRTARCGACAAGFGGFPYCVDLCVIPSVSCIGRATAVRGSPMLCTCTCEGRYSGRLCDRCAVGFSTFPFCLDACSVPSVSCRGLADSVTHAALPSGGSTPVGGAGETRRRSNKTRTVSMSLSESLTARNPVELPCRCECRRGYGGALCGSCDDGFVRVPTPSAPFGFVCRDSCTNVRVSCSNNAVNVTPSPVQAGNCSCNCHPRFAGQYCSECANGYTNYPTCEDACTNVTVSCVGNATAVRGKSPSSCECACVAGYTGARCQLCARGYGGWPRCVDICTEVSVSCNRRGLNVSYIFNETQAEDGTPSLPPSGGPWGDPFDSESSAPSSRPPLPPRKRMVLRPARPRAAGSSPTLPAPAPPQPQSQTGGNSSSNGSVAPATVPAMELQTLSATLSESASLRWWNRVCKCGCQRGYAGDRCQRCDTGYDGYPVCRDACTSASVSCTSFAISVVPVNNSNTTGGSASCSCTCTRGYGGARCDRCASGYNGYPTCVDDCTNLTVSCNGPERSTGVGGQLGVCVCRCLAPFAGPNCSRCSDAYWGYPNCALRPTPPPLPPPRLILLSSPTINAKSIRTGDYLATIVRLSLVNDEFAVDGQAAAASMPVGRFFVERCVKIVCADDAPFGPGGRIKHLLLASQSVLALNATFVELRLVQHAQIFVLKPTSFDLTIDTTCLQRRDLFRGSAAALIVAITVDPETVDPSFSNSISGMVATTTALSALAGSAGAFGAAQNLVLLGGSGCSKAQSHGVTSVASYLTSPLGFWGGRTAQFLGVFLPFVLVLVAHYAAVAVLAWAIARSSSSTSSTNNESSQNQKQQQRKRHRALGRAQHRQQQEQRRAASLARRAEMFVADMFRSEQPMPLDVRFCFPGISLLFARLLLPGLVFHSTTVFRSFDVGGIVAGLIGGVTAIAFISFLMIRYVFGVLPTASSSSASMLSSGALPTVSHLTLDQVQARVSVLNQLLPTTYYAPAGLARAQFPALSEVRSPPFVAIEPLIGFVVGLANGVQPSTVPGCVIQYGFLSVMFVGAALVCLLVRPFRTTAINVFTFVAYGGLSAVAVSSAVEADEAGGFGASVIAVATVLTAGAALARAVVTIVVFIWDLRWKPPVLFTEVPSPLPAGRNNEGTSRLGNSVPRMDRRDASDNDSDDGDSLDEMLVRMGPSFHQSSSGSRGAAADAAHPSPLGLLHAPLLDGGTPEMSAIEISPLRDSQPPTTSSNPLLRRDAPTRAAQRRLQMSELWDQEDDSS